MSSASSRPRVLFVDDDLFAAQTYLDVLRDAGFDVVQASGPDEALKIAQSQGFSLMVLDARMPSGSLGEVETAGGHQTGVVLARAIRRLIPDAQIVIFTLSLDRSIQDWCSRFNVKYLTKQRVSPEDLPRELRRVMRHEHVSPRVFIVHGRQKELVAELKDYLQNQLMFDEPITLLERPGAGKTIIEKLEQYATEADVVFVLFTPDDIGTQATSPQSHKTRPRMNAVFESGFFLGALQRKSGRVILLNAGVEEVPSDLSGIAYVDISSGIAAADARIRAELKEWL